MMRNHVKSPLLRLHEAKRGERALLTGTMQTNDR